MKTVSNKQCLLCSDSNKRLFCLTKHKAVNEHFVEWIEKCFNLKLPIPIKLPFVCEKCAKMYKAYRNFKFEYCENIKTVIENCTRKKRLAKTPISALKLTIKKETVPDNKICGKNENFKY